MATSTDIQRRDQAGGNVVQGKWGGYSREDVDTLKSTICTDLNDSELAFFLANASRRGLDPFARQVYATVRREQDGRGEWRRRLTIQTGIDGYRSIAQGTGEYEGQDPARWTDGTKIPCAPCGTKGVTADGVCENCSGTGKAIYWTDVWLKDGPPKAARIAVYRKGHSRPSVAVARFGEYAVKTQNGSLNSMWSKMPANQLAKCAEALALRKAFPEELGWLRTEEEMEQANSHEATVAPPTPSGQAGGRTRQAQAQAQARPGPADVVDAVVEEVGAGERETGQDDADGPPSEEEVMASLRSATTREEVDALRPSVKYYAGETDKKHPLRILYNEAYRRVEAAAAQTTGKTSSDKSEPQS